MTSPCRAFRPGMNPTTTIMKQSISDFRSRFCLPPWSIYEGLLECDGHNRCDVCFNFILPHYCVSISRVVVFFASFREKHLASLWKGANVQFRDILNIFNKCNSFKCFQKAFLNLKCTFVFIQIVKGVLLKLFNLSYYNVVNYYQMTRWRLFILFILKSRWKDAKSLCITTALLIN